MEQLSLLTDTGELLPSLVKRRHVRKVCALESPDCPGQQCGRPVTGSGMCAFHAYRRKHGLSDGSPKYSHAIHKACSYNTAHDRCAALWGPARNHPCAGCGGAAEHWAYDGTDPVELCGTQKGYSRVFSRYPEFYMPLCRKCHGPRDTTWRRELKDQFSEFLVWKKLQTG